MAELFQYNLCGNEDKYKEIICWIKSQLISAPDRLSFQNFLFISGTNGIGKTTSIKLICNALDLHMIYITTSICGSSEELNDLIIKHCSSSMLQILLNDKREKIIVIDEFDSMMSIDRTINLTIYNILNGNYQANNKTSKKASIVNLKRVPIVCIASSDIMKRIGIIKKKCKHIQLDKPSQVDICKLLLHSYPDQKIETLQKIAKDANGNISQAMEHLSFQSIEKGFNKIDESLSLNVLYSKSFDREKIRRIVLSDAWLIPLKYHENMISELSRCKASKKQSNEYYKQFIMHFIDYDILMHNNATHNAVDVFSSIVYQLTNIPLKPNKTSDIENFTKILSYLSLQKKHTKNSYTGLYQIGSYHTNIAGRNYMFFN